MHVKKKRNKVEQRASFIERLKQAFVVKHTHSLVFLLPEERIAGVEKKGPLSFLQHREHNTRTNPLQACANCRRAIIAFSGGVCVYRGIVCDYFAIVSA